MIHVQQFNRKSVLIVTAVVWAIVVMLSLYAWIIVYPKRTEPQVRTQTENVAVNTPAISKKMTYDFPSRLLIPKINVNAPVNYMGLTPEGDMESPKGADDVGWYKFGSRPGNPGSAVIAGHLGLKGQSVFMNLDQLQVGDEVTIMDAEDRSISFKVKNIRIYGKDEKPDEVFKTSDTPHLNLITCNGAWIESERTYAQRLVVFTDIAS